MLTEVKGLVIRTVNLSDNDKLLTIFTEEQGKITAVANGSRVLKSRYLAAAQLFCYGSYVLYQRGERYWVREVSLIESFFDLRAELSRMSLAAYICDVADDVVEENAPEKDFLRLVLNSLYAIANGKFAQAQIKAVFEMRAAAVLGFCPMLDGCHTCGKTEGELYLDVMNGSLRCGDCFGSDEDIELRKSEGQALMIIPLSRSVLAAMRYVIGSPSKRIFSFKLEDDELEPFCRVCERYLTNHLERGFKTLDFYKNIKKLDI